MASALTYGATELALYALLYITHTYTHKHAYIYGVVV